MGPSFSRKNQCQVEPARTPSRIAKKVVMNIAFRQTNNGVSALSRVYGNWAWRARLQESMRKI